LQHCNCNYMYVDLDRHKQVPLLLQPQQQLHMHQQLLHMDLEQNLQLKLHPHLHLHRLHLSLRSLYSRSNDMRAYALCKSTRTYVEAKVRPPPLDSSLLLRAAAFQWKSTGKLMDRSKQHLEAASLSKPSRQQSPHVLKHIILHNCHSEVNSGRPS